MTVIARDWEHLMGQARSKCSGASDAQLKAQFYDCMQEFFDKSQCWSELIDVPIVANVQDYVITPSGGQIIRLFGVWDQSFVPQPAVISDFGDDGRNANLHFQNPYNTSQTFVADVVKNICLPTTKHGVPDMPSWVLPKFGFKIVDGVVGQLMNEDRRPYSNPQKATYYLRRFREVMGEARAAAIRARTIGAQRWVYPQSWQTRTQRGGISVGNPNNFE
jgi:hypothetical protein